MNVGCIDYSTIPLIDLAFANLIAFLMAAPLCLLFAYMDSVDEREEKKANEKPTAIENDVRGENSEAILKNELLLTQQAKKEGELSD